MTESTKSGCLYFTNNEHPYHVYTFLKVRGDPVLNNKDKGKPKGRDHINGIEGFWSFANIDDIIVRMAFQ
jgi:transposase